MQESLSKYIKDNAGLNLQEFAAAIGEPESTLKRWWTTRPIAIRAMVLGYPQLINRGANANH